MFGVYFGRYLMEIGVIQPDQYEGLLEATRNSKLMMGFLAVEEGLMSEEQAAEINRIQQLEDKRFGDIAIEKGYLTEENVSDLLDKQGDSYLLFVQAIIESGLLDMAGIQDYLAKFRKDKGLTAAELEDVKSGDCDRIIPLFMKNVEVPDRVRDYIELTARNLVRFIDRFFRMENVEKVDLQVSDCIAYQTIHGDKDYLTAFCGNLDELDTISWGFMSGLLGPGESISYEVLDVVAEYLNVNNGVFVTKLDCVGVEERSDYPVYYYDPSKITSTMDMFRVPLFISNMQVDLIICCGKGWTVEML